MTELLTELAPSLQKLIDARLDNIDRALLSTDTSRYERRQIVSAVEDQIQELVSRNDKDEHSREDILRILASLDPPEAFGSGSMQQAYEPRPHRTVTKLEPSRSSNSIEPKGSILAIVSVTLGALSFVAILSVFVLAFFGFALSGLLSMAAMICGIVALCQLMFTGGKGSAKAMSIIGIASFPVGIILMYLMLLILEG
jgi:uncharacterized membrane protein